MGMSETRRKILEIIESRNKTKIKDLEDLTGLNRSGIIRHVNESAQSGWIKKESMGREVNLTITESGLVELGLYNLDTIAQTVKNADPTCIGILMELMGYVKGIDEKTFINSAISKFDLTDKEVKKCVGFFIEHRMMGQKKNRIYLTQLAMVLLREDVQFKDAISTNMEKMIKATQRTVLRRFKRNIHKTGFNSDYFKKVYFDALYESEKCIKYYLHENRKTPENIIDDDKVFEKIENIISDEINRAGSTYLFGAIGPAIIKELEPGIIKEFEHT